MPHEITQCYLPPGRGVYEVSLCSNGGAKYAVLYPYVTLQSRRGRADLLGFATQFIVYHITADNS